MCSFTLLDISMFCPTAHCSFMDYSHWLLVYTSTHSSLWPQLPNVNGVNILLSEVNLG